MTAVHKPVLLRGVASLVAFAALVVGVAQNSASAQSSHIETQAQTPTTVPGLVITMSFEIPLSTTSAGLPTGTFVKATVTVTNPAPVTLVNQPMVLRFGQKPDQILGVDDGTGKVGVIDPATGAWYHTIATIAANSSTTYSVTYGKLCAGRWAFAARVGDRLTNQFVQWAGQSDARCVGDETTNPQPAAFYQLPWPSSIAIPATALTVATSSTTSTTSTSTTTTTTSTTINPLLSTTSVPPLPGGPTTSTSSTRPGATSTTLLSLDKIPSTVPSTTRSTTTRPTSLRTTTTVLFCKTVGGKRYCAPKSSIYKPGQKKSTEVKSTKPTKKK